MTDSQKLIDAFDARVERRENRRAFFTNALGVAAVGGAFVYATAAAAQTAAPAQIDVDVLNFALNLEYLEANFYSYASFGTPIDPTLTTGTGTNGVAASVATSTGARAVNFTDPVVSQYAKEIALDEIQHVKFLRTTLASLAVAQPQIDIGTSPNGAFSTAARAAGIIGATTTAAPTFFDPYASDENFLLGAYIFEDVGVTAYKGASPLLVNKTYLEAAAGILAVEAYHASIVRTVLYGKGMSVGGTAIPAAFGGGTYPATTPNPALITNAGKISAARDSLDGTSATPAANAVTPDPITGKDISDDQGIAPVTTGAGVRANIAPLNQNGLAYSRTANAVLNIVYLTPNAAKSGGFFPAGMNGNIVTSTQQV
ncbi:ferritin-like domain-containing protein [uncultured Sphingomonas sp.]|uniref:ferritin-like domain-containing protein n=1 Tax=uncultured Sphingomonas sp. TaxID=158754 RepID=UPI0035CBC7BD